MQSALTGSDKIGKQTWAVGVDLGGTKVNIAQVDASGSQLKKSRFATEPVKAPDAMIGALTDAIRAMVGEAATAPVGVGIGVAGQIEAHTGKLHFAPNLGWKNVALQSELSAVLGLPVVVTNDVRAATWGEWIHGAGQGCDDILCLFLGTGIGGGIVSGGKMLTGSSNSAGELGHVTIDLHGPACTCGNQGCFEALASGWAIAHQAREAIGRDSSRGSRLLQKANGQLKDVTAQIVIQAAQQQDPLALEILEASTQAVVAGAVGLVNAFNPARLILGGGLVDGQPGLIAQVQQGIAQRALAAARLSLQVLPARLANDAGVIGAATLALKTFSAV